MRLFTTQSELLDHKVQIFLNVPIIRSMYTEGAFSYCGLADARSITSMPGFKIRLKTQAYTQQLCVCVFKFCCFCCLKAL